MYTEHPTTVGEYFVGGRKMRVARIDEKICDKSPFCPAAASCRFKAFRVILETSFRVNISIDEEKCTGCGVCVRYCGPGAIKLIEKEKAS